MQENDDKGKTEAKKYINLFKLRKHEETFFGMEILGLVIFFLIGM